MECRYINIHWIGYETPYDYLKKIELFEKFEKSESGKICSPKWQKVEVSKISHNFISEALDMHAALKTHVELIKKHHRITWKNSKISEIMSHEKYVHKNDKKLKSQK